MPGQLRIVPEEQMTPELDAAIRKGLCVCFPDCVDNFSLTRKWHGSGPAWTAVVEEGGVVIAHAGAVDRTVRVGARQVTVGGVQNVYVLPQQRASGLSNMVMKAIMDEGLRRGKDFGLLFCVPRLEKLYGRMGWITIPVDTPVTRTDEGRDCPIPGKNIAMYFPLVQKVFPQGEIHLQGNDW